MNNPERQRGSAIKMEISLAQADPKAVTRVTEECRSEKN